MQPVAVVDDDLAVREAVTTVLGSTRKVLAYASAREALTAAWKGALPNIVLMDLHLPGEDSRDAIRRMRALRSGISVIAFTSHQTDDYVFEAIHAGAVGYLLKQHALEKLADLVCVVESGGSPITPSIARRVMEAFHAPGSKLESLSPRERDVLSCFARDMTYEETARSLGIAIDTVRTHVRRAYAKLEVTTRSSALVEAIRRGILR